MAETQAFLQKNSLECLTSAFGSPIIVKAHPVFPNLVLLRYKLSAGKHFQHKVMREARGLILDQKQDWKPIAYPYEKFFNRHEKFAPKENEIDWESVRVTEKADGSLITLYYYANQWRVSTTGQPDAGENQNTSQSFYSLFWKVWNRNEMKLPSPEDQSLCFMFELMTTENRIVVRMEEAGHSDIIWLHGVRNMESLEELMPLIYAEKYNWPLVREYKPEQVLSDEYAGHWTLQKVVRYVSTLSPTISEGVVVCDKNFQRLKVKSPSYVALLHLNVKGDTDMNARQMLQIVKSSEGSEFLAYYPQWTSLCKHVESEFSSFCERIDYVEKSLQSENDIVVSSQEKEALQAFTRWKNENEKGNTSSIDFFRDTSVTVPQLASWMKLSESIPSQHPRLTYPEIEKDRQGFTVVKTKKSKPQVKKTIPSGGFTIQQPVFKPVEKFNPNKEKELAKLDTLIQSFKEQDANITTPSNEQPKPQPKKKNKKKKNKKSKSKRR